MTAGRHRRRLTLLGGLLLLSLAQGCAYLASSKRAPVAVPGVDYSEFNPAGVWVYEDRIVTGEAELDEHGNGSYPWKGGYFVTRNWEGGVWTGTWHQPGNNREGGFEGRIAPDFDHVAGRWWYTRIGSDTAPIRPGGRFTLTRVSP